MKEKILRTGLVFLPLTVAVILLDYFSKTWIINNVPAYEPEGYIEVIRNFFSIVHVHNHGAAFSFLADREGWQKVLFGAVAVLVSCYLLFLMYRNKASDLLPNISFALIIGGALGNLYDRVQYSYVIDFLDFYMEWGGRIHHWPAFNIADCGVCVGVFLFVVYEMFFNKKDEEKQDNAGK